MGTETMRSAVLAFLLSGLMGCFSDQQASPPGSPIPDPYAGMDCAGKIDAIAKDVQAFSPTRTAAPKAAADTANPADTTGKRPILVDLKGYPPVAGLDPTPPDTTSVNDSRPSEPVPVSAPDYGVQWIPPVGFAPAGGSPVIDGSAQQPEPLPKEFSAVLVVVNAAYRAEVGIYDYDNRLIRSFTQDFGFQGELENPNRVVPGQGIASYLVWDTRDAEGEQAPTGAYLWRVRLRFETGEVEDRTVKAGLIGPECREP